MESQPKAIKDQPKQEDTKLIKKTEKRRECCCCARREEPDLSRFDTLLCFFCFFCLICAEPSDLNCCK